MSNTSRRMQMATSGQDAIPPEYWFARSAAYSGQFDVRAQALGAGWDGNAPLRFILDGCKILAQNPSQRALYISGPFPNGITLEPRTGTVVMGRGGSSASGSGGTGGSAVYIDTDITIDLNSANIANTPSAVAFLGGGGAGGSAFMRDRDAGSKSTTYQTLFFYGGGGCGGGGTPLNTGPTSIGVTSSLGTTSGTIPATISYTMYTPNSTGYIPNGYGCVGIWNSSNGELTSSSGITGNVGGTTVPTQIWSQSFNPYVYYQTGYYVKLGTASNIYNAGVTTALTSTSISAAFFASGHGGGYGASGSSGYHWSAQLTSTDHTGGSYVGGVGGKAIVKQFSGLTVTFTGDINPSTSFGSSNRAVFVGGIT